MGKTALAPSDVLSVPACRTFMLDFYRMVSLVPEQEAAICSGMSPASLQDSTDDTQTKVTTTISGGGGLNLGCLLLPCLNLLDSFHLGADIRLASPQQTERRRIFAEQVREGGL